MAIHPTRNARSRIYGSESKTRGKIERKAVSTEYSTLFGLQPEVAFAQYFDVDTKLWKPLASVAQLDETTDVFCSAELIGSYLFVVTGVQVRPESYHDYVVYRYHI